MLVWIIYGTVHQPQQRRFSRAVPSDEAHFFQRLPGLGVPFRVRKVQCKPPELLKIRNDELRYLHTRNDTDLPKRSHGFPASTREGRMSRRIPRWLVLPQSHQGTKVHKGDRFRFLCALVPWWRHCYHYGVINAATLTPRPRHRRCPGLRGTASAVRPYCRRSGRRYHQ